MRREKYTMIGSIIHLALAVMLLLALITSVFMNPQPLFDFHIGKLAFCVLAGIVLFYLLGILVQRLPQALAAAEGKVLAVLFGAFILLQFFFAWQLKLRPTDQWDFGLVYTYAKDYVLEGTLPDTYFQYFPNNQGLYALWCGFFSLLRLFGFTDFTWPATVLNIIAIDASLWMLYAAARLLGGRRKALLALLLAFATSPFLLYVPVYYTDTLTLVFPMGAVLGWLHIRRHYKAGLDRRWIWQFCVLSAFVAVGTALKVTVVIIWIAIVLDILLFLSGKARFWMLLGGGGALVLLLLLNQLLMRVLPIFPAYDSADGIPFIHWIMMGLNGTGQYSNDDYELILAQPGQTRWGFAWQEIGRRIGEMGPGGLVTHLLEKLGFTFGDGTYWAAVKLDRNPVGLSFLHAFVIWPSTYYKYTAYATSAIEGGMLAWCGIGAIQAVRKRDNELCFVHLALLGLMVFLLLWETRARYLVNYLPLFLLCAALALPRSLPAFLTKILKKEKKAQP